MSPILSTADFLQTPTNPRLRPVGFAVTRLGLSHGTVTSKVKNASTAKKIVFISTDSATEAGMTIRRGLIFALGFYLLLLQIKNQK